MSPRHGNPRNGPCFRRNGTRHGNARSEASVFSTIAMMTGGTSGEGGGGANDPMDRRPN